MDPFEQDRSSTSCMDDMVKSLIRDVIQSNWKEVANIYEQHPEAHHTRITQSGDTALHIAISDGNAQIVEELVSRAVIRTTPEALAIQNELGNTPLHLAASLGNVRICELIARTNSRLIGMRNRNNETPFFLAALNGRKQAFLCLHSLLRSGEGYEYCRRKDGETILHSAISREYFDLAFQIIHHYGKLVNWVDEQGRTPLHILASKPYAFRSGSDIRGFQKLIYHCIYVDELRPSTYRAQDIRHGENAMYPANYQTCVNFSLCLRGIMRMLMCLRPKSRQEDAELQLSDHEQGSSMSHDEGSRLLPTNYLTCFHWLQVVSKVMLVILGLGSVRRIKMFREKQRHIWSIQIMEKLLEKASRYAYKSHGRIPLHQLDPVETTPYVIVDSTTVAFNNNFLIPPASNDDYHSLKTRTGGDGEAPEMDKGETTILVAAKNGVIEMVEKILDLFPVAIYDINNEKKNIVLLAVENRQPHLYTFLLGRKTMGATIFRQRDAHGNSALHLAAMLPADNLQPWPVLGAALQMQWEIKWYKFVRKSMPVDFFFRYNNEGQTAEDIFSKSHESLLNEAGKWLSSISQSCSVLASLIATVAFTSSTTVPGGVRSESGIPTLEDEPAFTVFAISSVIALCFSVASLLMFLVIHTSRYQEKDFSKYLPMRLLLGSISLVISVVSMLVSYFAGHSFLLNNKLKNAAFAVYAVIFLPATLFAARRIPFYIGLVLLTFRKVPIKKPPERKHE